LVDRAGRGRAPATGPSNGVRRFSRRGMRFSVAGRRLWIGEKRFSEPAAHFCLGGTRFSMAGEGASVEGMRFCGAGGRASVEGKHFSEPGARFSLGGMRFCGAGERGSVEGTRFSEPGTRASAGERDPSSEKCLRPPSLAPPRAGASRAYRRLSIGRAPCFRANQLVPRCLGRADA
jgi:hypothetical protein